MTFKLAGVDSLILYFGNEISQNVAQKVQNAYKILKTSKNENFLEFTPSYTSILVRFNLLHVNYEEAKGMIEKILKSKKVSTNEENSTLIEIPVYYGLEVGLDLKQIALHHNLSIEEVIKIHSQKEYLVYAIGFLPGFAYMGEVDEKIAMPRLANPRANIPKGSVGIADNQAAIYPQKSPGGWQILGRTPLNMFDLNYDGYSYLKVGDKVKYLPISKKEFLSKGGEI